jgi:hypothetical protein
MNTTKPKEREVPMIERRRSRRMATRVPLEVRVGDVSRVALTADINRDGAVMRSPIPWAIGIQLEIKNQRTGLTALGRVVWRSEPDPAGFYSVGIEFAGVVSDFWGADYRLADWASQ